MKTLQGIKKWLADACVYYTATSLAIILLNLLLQNKIDMSVTVRVSSFLLLLPASLCLSAGGLLLANQKLSFPLRAILHYGITLISFLLFLWLPASAGARGSATLIILVIVTALYWLIFFSVHLIRGRVMRLWEETKD
ncbi:MAG: hypothetical protein IKB75_05190 [Clostridia bacterium]|nr:hypothetical protein [Clostridia bacterium]